MEFAELVRIASRSFPQNGSFELLPGQGIRKRIRESRVPDKPGIYFICGTNRGRCYLLYIGKAGSLTNDGSFKGQKLSGRLAAKQQGIRRQKFYQQKMAELQLDNLLFYWFVTFDKDVHIIPAKAEAGFLQEYFNGNGRLPAWNAAM